MFFLFFYVVKNIDYSFNYFDRLVKNSAQYHSELAQLLRVPLKYSKDSSFVNAELSRIGVLISNLPFTARTLTDFPARNPFANLELSCDDSSTEMVIWLPPGEASGSILRVTFFVLPFYDARPLAMERMGDGTYCPKCFHRLDSHTKSSILHVFNPKHHCPKEKNLPFTRTETHEPDESLQLPPGFFFFQAKKNVRFAAGSASTITRIVRGIWFLVSSSPTRFHVRMLIRHKLEYWLGRFNNNAIGFGVTYAKRANTELEAAFEKRAGRWECVARYQTKLATELGLL